MKNIITADIFCQFTQSLHKYVVYNVVNYYVHFIDSWKY